MAQVTLNQVSKRFDDTVAVDDLTLEVPEGEFFVLLGPTGAGKTSTLRLIAGLEKPDHGSVTIDGIDVTREPPAGRDVTFVFQQFSLYPNYNVRQNLMFPLKAPSRGLAKAEINRRTEWVAERLAITDKLDNPVTALSGGEMQRVALGRALTREPAVHLMDEPLSSLDAKLRESLRTELKNLQADIDSPIIYVTHDQEEALALADRIGVLHDGRLVQVGDPESVYERPDTLAVAHQLGSPAINIVGGNVLRLDADDSTTFGLRPEGIALADGRTGDEGVPGTVRQVEQLGAENTIFVMIDETLLRVSTPPDQLFAIGDHVRLTYRLEDLLVFDSRGCRIDDRADRYATVRAG